MKSPFRHGLIAAAILFSASLARADLFVFHLSPETSRTLESLGTKFIVGCVVVALGILAAGFLSRKK